MEAMSAPMPPPPPPPPQQHASEIGGPRQASAQSRQQQQQQFPPPPHPPAPLHHHQQQYQQQPPAPAPMAAAAGPRSPPPARAPALPTAAPTLKVMRLQAPSLTQPNAGSLGPNSMLGPAATLPDTFGTIHIGETFTAYLGVVNADPSLPIRNLSLSAQLQTPSRRWPLPSGLDGGGGEGSDGAGGALTVAPGSGVDTIVSRPIDEVGQHILRVEVSYGAGPTARTLRKFYRFGVASPLHIRELTARAGDDRCFVSIAVENAGADGITLSGAEFYPPPGLAAERIGGGDDGGAGPAPEGDGDDGGGAGGEVSAAALYDRSSRLEPGDSLRYLFSVRAESDEAALRGIAAGDELGKAVFAWTKAMGEAGRISSAPVRCPPARPPQPSPAPSSASPEPTFVVHGSGLSVDAAAAAANRMSQPTAAGPSDLDRSLPVTVEPIDPPARLTLAEPTEIRLLVVNHSAKPLSMQLQMRAGNMSGLVVCGRSCLNLGDVNPSGGSRVVTVRMVAMVAGLLSARGCSVLDVTNGREIVQPPLFSCFVERKK